MESRREISWVQQLIGYNVNRNIAIKLSEALLFSCASVCTWTKVPPFIIPVVEGFSSTLSSTGGNFQSVAPSFTEGGTQSVG